jgi:type II secretory pathway component PulF
MPTFAYTARDATGKSSSGTLVATALDEAARQLRAEGKYPVSIRPTDTPPADRGEQPAPSMPRARLSRTDVIQFSTQLAVMVETGVQLNEALECIARQADRPAVRAIVADLVEQIEGGASFSEALARHPRSFPRLYVSLMVAAEKTGRMGQLLQRATSYLRDENDILRRVKGALVYPAIMFGFATTTTIFLLVFVLPRFTGIYASKKAALPVPTQILMDLSDLLIGHWMGILATLAGGIAAGLLYFTSPGGRRAWHYIQLAAPLFGRMYRKLHLARGLRMAGTMAGAGVAILDCVQTARDLCGNCYFQELWDRVGEQIKAGRQLSDPLFDSPLVPAAVSQMISSGEKSGRLPAVMEQVAGYAETELREQILQLTRYIEPAMICAMGLIIGGISLALLLPVFTISRVMAAH